MTQFETLFPNIVLLETVRIRLRNISRMCHVSLVTLVRTAADIFYFGHSIFAGNFHMHMPVKKVFILKSL